MKKIIKAITIFLSIALMISSFIAMEVFAASTIISISSKSVQVGQNITVTVTINGGEAMYATEADFTYDASVLKFVSGDSSSGGNGSVHIVGMPGGATKQSYSLTFTALAEGSCTISVSNVKYVGNDEVSVNGASVPGITVKSATTSQPQVSSDANLTSLSVSGASLSPAFSASTTNYTATVSNEIESVTVNATAASGASVTGTGNIALKVGSNKHTVTVTAADGTKKSYTINIKRLAKDEDTTSSENEEPDDEEPTEDTPAVDVLQVQISGKSHHILSELPESVTAPSGFEPTTTEYNGVEVPVFASESNEYVLYSIKRDEDENIDYYLYDSLRDEFVLLPYMTINGRMFIFAHVAENLSAPAGYSESTANLGNSAVKVFCSDDEDLSDFCIIYCFVDGKYRFYSYDLLENTIQRAPDFELLSISEDTASDAVEEPANWLEAFRRMPTAGKTVIFTLIIAVLCIIALVVLLIIRAVNSREFDIDGVAFEPDDEFDDIDEINSLGFRPETLPTEPSDADSSAAQENASGEAEE